jgi:hypothetical protein
MSLKQLFVGVIFMTMASVAYSVQVTVNDSGNANTGGPVGSTVPNQVVPEPSTLALVSFGLLGFAMLRRRCD